MRPTRPLLFSGAIALTVLLSSAAAQDGLPEIGSSAGELISPAEEQRYGARVLAELRHLGMLLEDPLLEDYLDALGYRLASNSTIPGQQFTFFLIGSRDINAFATLGGTIGVNAGLLLTAESEDELAAVLAHEISHVSQRHIVRSVESARKDTLPIALAMIGAVLAAQSSGDDGNGTQAAIASGMALMQQRQINYTRANEHEADRIGIQTLARSGYDPMAMADFFGRMQRATRSSDSAQVPEMLRSHPVTTTRISEAKDRARGIATQIEPLRAPSAQPLNPALPNAMHASLLRIGAVPGRDFAWARERLRVLSARSPAEAVAEYRRRRDAGARLEDAERYGEAVAQILVGDPDRALATLGALATQHPDLYWIDLAMAEAEQRAGRLDAADARFAALLAHQPQNRAIALAYADALAARGRPQDGQRALEVLRPLLAAGQHDPAFQRAFGRAAELAGDLVRAGEAHAEVAFLTGRAEDALNQLQRLKDSHRLDYVQRARIDARMAAITPIVLELRAEGIHAGDERLPLAPLAPRAAFR